MKIKVIDFKEKVLWLLTTLLLASFYIFGGHSWSRYLLASIAAIIFFIGVLLPQQEHLRLKLTPFHGLVASFGFYCLLSSLWALNQSAAITAATTIFRLLIFYSLILWYYEQFDSAGRLLDCIMWGGYFIAIYTFIANGGYKNVMQMVQDAERVGEANANSIAMVCAIACVIQVHKCFTDKKVGSAIFAIPAIIIIAASQSRKAIIILIIGVLAAIVLSNYNPKKALKSCIKIFAFLAVAVIFLQFLLSLEIFDSANRRLQSMFNGLLGEGTADNSTKLRTMYIEIGLRQFVKTPILGAGMGSSKDLVIIETGRGTYLHNNYAELLACGGLVGFAIYYAIYAYLGYTFIKLRRYQRMETDICLLLLGILLIMDYGAVSYYGKTQYFYFVVCFVQAEILKKKRRECNNANIKTLEQGD